MKQRLVSIGILFFCVLPTLGCSSLPDVKTQSYARLRDEKTFETDFPTLWKAIESALRLNKVMNREPEEVSPTEFKRLSRRSLETDWIYSKSKTKYIEFQADGFPKKIYLQNRYKYQVVAEQVLGGIKVKVGCLEEIERLSHQGQSEGFSSAGEPDPNLASDLISKINRELNSAPPI